MFSYTVKKREESKIKTILFICTGNSCRSVMAKGIFQKMLGEVGKRDIRLTSAGTAAPPGMRPPAAVEEIMREKGIDVSAHRAIPLTADLIKEANLVLVMEKHHRQRILGMSPGASGKVFLLKEFSPHAKEKFFDILDPIGKPREIYQEVVGEIESCLRELLKNLDRYLL